MSLLSDLNVAASDPISLNAFVRDQFNEIYDYFNWSTDGDLQSNELEIKDFIIRKRIQLERLPATEKNFSFLTFLLDVSERLGLISGFKYLFTFLNSHHFDVGSRLEAAALYLINVKDAQTLLDRYNGIYELLQESFELEEDNVDKVLTTVVNFYAKTILDYGEFNIEVAKSIKNKLIESISNNEYSFLNHNLIHEMLATDISDFRIAYSHIHSILDIFLRRGKTKGREIAGYLTEEKTDYFTMLIGVGTKFSDVRKLSVAEHMANQNGRAIYYSLNRGTTIIDNESQLFGYMHSYGMMHFEKLQTAFAELPDEIFDKRINLIDWGCGQGMATMSLVEYCDEKGLSLNVERIVLIEPSELALRRASLHVVKFLKAPNIVTVHKELDKLSSVDVAVKAGVTLHLFSNILDIDSISITSLIRIVKESFSGKNYFVIVSPYVNDVRKVRIDSFIDAFRAKRNFELLASVNNKAGEWKKDWTIILRVFRVELNFKV